MFFERENSTSYMVVESTKELVSDYDVNVLEKAFVQGLLPMHIRNADGKVLCYYEITAKQQLKKVYTYAQLKWEDVKMICTSIAYMVREVNKYMLDWQYVKMDPEYMYVELCERKVYFAYLPERQDDNEDYCDVGIRKLFDYILEHFDHNSPKEEVVRVYDIYQRIIQNNYNASELDELVQVKEAPDAGTIVNVDCDFKEESCETDNKVKLDVIPAQVIEDEVEKRREWLVNAVTILKVVAFVITAAGALGILMPSVLPVSINIKPALILIVVGVLGFLVLEKIPSHVFTNVTVKKSKQPYELELVKDEMVADSEQVQVPSYDMEPQTMLLSEYVKNIAKSSDRNIRFVNYESGEVINFEKFPSVLGSLRDKCDVCVDDVLVSRMHAFVIKEGGDFYVEDMNSTNGTKVGDKTLVPNERCLLSDGDEILLATRFYKVEIS